MTGDAEAEIKAEKNSTYEEPNNNLEEEIALKEKEKNDSLLIAQKKEALEELNNFRKKYDEFNDITFFEDNRTPVYTNRNFIYPYIGKSGDAYWMKLRFQYTADDWLFIERARIKTDSNNYVISGVFERDHNSEIWEWYDETVGEKELEMLEDIANSEITKVRYEGTQYYKDRTLTPKEIDIIKKTIKVYKSLK